MKWIDPKLIITYQEINWCQSNVFSVNSEQFSVKSVQICSFFWSVFSRIHSEYGKMRTRKNSAFGNFLQWFLHMNLVFSLLNLNKYQCCVCFRIQQIFWQLNAFYQIRILIIQLVNTCRKLTIKTKLFYCLYYWFWRDFSPLGSL